MSTRLPALLALSALLPAVLAGCQSEGSGAALQEASASIQPAAPPEPFQYTSVTQTKYNPFTVDYTQPSAAAGGPAKSFVRVSSPGISIGSPQHEAVARAVVVEVASERLCQPGTQPQFQKQYGREVYLNERVQKWGAIVYCDAAPAYPPMNGGAMASASGSMNNAAGGYGGSTQPQYGGAPAPMAGAPMPPQPMSSVQDTLMPLPNAGNSPLPLSMMSSDAYR
ncbi:hypothetical protein U0C82_02250 [Fulvimarina sp. 2208YS6-2-32]|uniref:Lipoprotein n=1 Tax=Fulvimarina uroteuthidis TaxID=3098149 RepID=A0ABU5HXV3_9HYPH|nr:hypothetical protein [Fulvimarina sp. 2208YS6-2-32]MDY8107971.1 hypothetical protein [Fulvimarina sp. 2208YS6-2-32]